MRDPVLQLRRRLIGLRAAALAIALPLGLWAIYPLDVGVESQNDLDVLRDIVPAAPSSSDSAPETLDVSAFTARLWNPVPQLAAAKSPDSVKPPAPPRITLVGIIEGPTRQAALYDALRDRLLIVSIGDIVQDCSVEQITPGTVVLRQGEVRHELRLREERS